MPRYVGRVTGSCYARRVAYKEKLQAFLEKEAADRNIDLDDDSLVESGIIDSLGIMKLVQFIESEFSIVIEDAELTPDNFDTVADIVKLLESKKS